MQDNYYILKELSVYLNNKLCPSEIINCFSQEKNQVILKLRCKGIEYYLVYSCSNELPYLYLKNNFGVAKKNVAFIFENLKGYYIENIRVHEDDRLIILKLSNESELIYSFAKNKLNLFLVNENIIQDSFKNKNTFINQYLLNVLQHKLSAINKIDTVKDYLKTEYLKFGKIYHDELIYNLNIDYKKDLNPLIKEKIDSEINKYRIAIEVPEFILYRKNDKIYASLMKLSSMQIDFEMYDNINDLLIAYIKEATHRKYSIEVKEKNIRDILSKIKKNGEKIKNINIRLNEALYSEKYLNYGSYILENMHNIGNEETLKYETKDGIEMIKLDRNLSTADNAQRYFQKYKRQKASLKLLQTKITKLEEDNSKHKIKLSEIQNMSDLKQIKKLDKTDSSRKEDDETNKFRKFLLENDYQVWVGKDSISNDLLTMRYSSPNDLWFHIRGTSGSHTVLKTNNRTENIDKNIILTAASICAYYSKSRNAGTVPVAYCLRKFVKKKKGFKSGSVLMEREKVVFVKPKLPE